MLGLELSVKFGSPVYLAVEGLVVSDKDILSTGTVVQVLLAGGVHRGSFLIEEGLSGEDGLVVQPYSVNGEMLSSELVRSGLGRPLVTYPDVWAECHALEQWD